MNHTRQILVLALGAATLLVTGLIMWPLFTFLPSAAMRAIILAPLYGLFADNLLRRARFPGALTLFGFVLGAILSIFTPLLIPVSVLGAGGAELIGGGLALFVPGRWQDHPRLRKLVSALFPALQFPLMLIALAWVVGEPATSMLTRPTIVLILTGLGILLGYFGCLLGEQIAKRMPKAA